MADRFDQIMDLSPRRFHVSESPPYGFGIVLCGHMNEAEEALSQFENQTGGIANCKPGIWRSAVKSVAPPAGQPAGLGLDQECYLYWVADGSIDLAQPVEDWAAYEEKTREEDSAVDIDKILPHGVEWIRAGSYYDDGGVCAVLSTEYLTSDAADKIFYGDEEPEEEVEFGYYLETITLNHMDGKVENANFTLGGMVFGQDSVGGPPYISVARQNKQAIAVKLHRGTGDESYDGVDEDGMNQNSKCSDSSTNERTHSAPAPAVQAVAVQPPALQADSVTRDTKKEMEILNLRLELQKRLTGLETKMEDMNAMSRCLTSLEFHGANLDHGIIRMTKINKVLKVILKRENIPKDKEFRLKERSQALLDMWNLVF